jgi:hypothetical protein
MGEGIMAAFHSGDHRNVVEGEIVACQNAMRIGDKNHRKVLACTAALGMKFLQWRTGVVPRLTRSVTHPDDRVFLIEIVAFNVYLCATVN